MFWKYAANLQENTHTEVWGNCWNYTLPWEFSCKFATYFQNTSLQQPLSGTTPDWRWFKKMPKIISFVKYWFKKFKCSKLLNLSEPMALNIWRKMHRSWHTAGKDNVACLFSSVLTKTIFNISARTAKFKMTYVRVVLAYTNSTALTGNYTRKVIYVLIILYVIYVSINLLSSYLRFDNPSETINYWNYIQIPLLLQSLFSNIAMY